MYDIRWIRDNAAAFDAGLKSRGAEPQSERAIALDEARKAAVSALQGAQERRNALSKEIGQAKARKDVATAEALKAEVARLKDAAPELEEVERAASAALRDALAAIPNTPAADVPIGKDEHDNVVKSVHGAKPSLGFAPKEHYELGEALGLMDFEAAARMSGARFVVLKGALARLERAIGQFFLDQHTKAASGDLHGYTEVNPPLLVRDAAMFGTAQLPKFVNDQFLTINRSEFIDYISSMPEFEEWQSKSSAFHNSNVKSSLVSMYNAAVKGRIKEAAEAVSQGWLVPTAEVPLTNLVREQILAAEALPMRVTALTPCFRAEAGSAGRDTRGMLRQHQFMKCELVSVTAPEGSAAEHERMLANAEHVLRLLGLHYRVVTLCTGDMGFASTKTYDIEAWLPGQDTYREISSCSNCGDFQARRMDARVRGADGKPIFVHTLNGSGVAVGRALIAVMENYQNADGSITVPEALRPYMGGLERIVKA
jgi:seryl-tRNA synthetase